MPNPFGLDIVTCPEWHARKPKGQLELVGKAPGILFHHTAGHAPVISDPASESVAEAIAYRHAIQNYHMDHNGWNDSGDNFLVCRNGLVLQGRWLTVSSIVAGHMVRSAHCPGFNHWIGIEHEHYGNEPMPPKQKKASATLQAWIAWHYDLSRVLPVDPHSKHFATSCPANLISDIPGIRNLAQAILSGTV